MKQPFWILNSTLLLMVIGSVLFIFLAKIKIPPKQSIEPYEVSFEAIKEPKIDTEIIYKKDLFNTYLPIITPTVSEPEQKIPTPPAPVEPKIPEPFIPQFLDPLDVTLTGIIIQEDETKNKAIILDNKTKNQVNYNIGDEIEDAQLIRILRNKIILIRSNGQQEILYLREDDVKEDSPTNKNYLTKDVIKKINENNYLLDPYQFVYYIRNLGEFLEVFDLSTAYKDGESIGSKIIKLDPKSIAIQMGLLPGDIIEKINDISANNNDNRFEIYKKIILLSEDDTIKVEIIRNNLPLTINYKLKKIRKIKERSVEEKTELIKLEEDRIESEKIKIMKEKYQFAPTIEEITSREKQNLFKRRK